ncbi:tRNA pseudouridine(55) synthase TruB [Yimella sp. cx-51]|uniref:tRNA pseudouridine(55) synthase TruB n=1 Tax=Yimella sp. cx-51 TaxID=2770551 RepID=UPI00165E8605|nr:tRNA pseudouridine(55) synthase TruB [Yimella sp. cx-51]MBC9956850.1 tRNA pseudouridine(55) synthase TruB [Yimella sp. cx-51]QTH39076.1 tRNA pseudouridine(55) synthase TruB [Yimella sp. cx-51]
MTPDGLLLVDKPSGWTSHDVVARTRRLAGTRRVGHAGTLDPMATGLLVLGVNRATKLLTFLVGCDKTYTATVRLGQSTVTDDAEGDVTTSAPAHELTTDAVAAAITRLTGEIQQVPSSVSAIKVDGHRAYAKVRGGDEVKLKARPITVHSFDLMSSTPRPDVGKGVLDLEVEVDVSSGTYVRALARDLGAALGVGGHLTALRRTRVGRFDLSGVPTMEALNAAHESGAPLEVIPMARAARDQFPVRELSEADARTLRYGQRLPAGGPNSSVVAAAAGDDLVAMLDQSGERPKSLVVFPASFAQ